MAVSLIGSDVANAYTGMLALAGIVSCFKDVRHSIPMRVIGSLLVIVAGTICALAGYSHFIANLTNFLDVLLYVFIPWTAINLTDYYLVRRGKYDVPSFFTPSGVYGGVLRRGLIAYILAVAVQVPFVDKTFFTGPLVEPLGGTDISWVVGGVAGVVFYLIALQVPSPRGQSPPSRSSGHLSPQRPDAAARIQSRPPARNDSVGRSYGQSILSGGAKPQPANRPHATVIASLPRVCVVPSAASASAACASS
jgi:NCS1 family nucleobase:cation symporter-1